MPFIYIALCLLYYSWWLSKVANRSFYLEKLHLNWLQNHLEYSTDGVIYLLQLPTKAND